MLILILFLTISILNIMANRKNVLDQNKKKLLDSVNAANQVYTNEELSALLDEQRTMNETQQQTIQELKNDLANLSNKKLDKQVSLQNNWIKVQREPVGYMGSGDTKRYILIRLGNIRWSVANMILAEIKIYQYYHYNTILVGGYIYPTNDAIVSPSVSYLQKTNKYPVSFAVKDDFVYLVIEKGTDPFVLAYVSELMDGFNNSTISSIDSNWQMYSASDLNGFTHITKCIEVN